MSVAIAGALFPAIPVRDVRIAEKHLNSLGPVNASASQDLDPLSDLSQPLIALDLVASIGPGNAVKRSRHLQQFAADFEIKAFENGRGGL
jgi:hypothetical protein